MDGAFGSAAGRIQWLQIVRQIQRHGQLGTRMTQLLDVIVSMLHGYFPASRCLLSLSAFPFGLLPRLPATAAVAPLILPWRLAWRFRLPPLLAVVQFSPLALRGHWRAAVRK